MKEKLHFKNPEARSSVDGSNFHKQTNEFPKFNSY